MCLFCNQTQRFIYRSGEALYGECSFVEEQPVYVINIHGKTVQWKSRKKSCSIIKVVICIIIYSRVLLNRVLYALKTHKITKSAKLQQNMPIKDLWYMDWLFKKSIHVGAFLNIYQGNNINFEFRHKLLLTLDNLFVQF